MIEVSPSLKAKVLCTVDESEKSRSSGTALIEAKAKGARKRCRILKKVASCVFKQHTRKKPSVLVHSNLTPLSLDSVFYEVAVRFPASLRMSYIAVIC